MMTSKTNEDNRTQASDSNRLLRISQVLNLIPLGRSTLWAWVKSGRFPAPVKIGPRTTTWRERDILDFISKAPDDAK